MISHYASLPSTTYFFDCDGVILDSNRIKTDAFRELAERYMKDGVEEFVDFHRRNGGLSRFAKLEIFFKDFLKLDTYQNELSEAIQVYGQLVEEKLLHCAENKGLRKFLGQLSKESKRYVVSGGLESEVQKILKAKNLAHHFQGIYGSPRKKQDILQDLARENGGSFTSPIFLGDSKIDYETANSFGMNFIFFYGLTEFDQWQEFFKNKSILCVKDFDELLCKF